MCSSACFKKLRTYAVCEAATIVLGLLSSMQSLNLKWLSTSDGYCSVSEVKQTNKNKKQSTTLPFGTINQPELAISDFVPSCLPSAKNQQVYYFFVNLPDLCACYKKHTCEMPSSPL